MGVKPSLLSDTPLFIIIYCAVHIEKWTKPAPVLEWSLQTQAQPRRTVRAKRLIFASLQSTWNDQKRETVHSSRGGFSIDQWLCCSSGRAKPARFGWHLPLGKHALVALATRGFFCLFNQGQELGKHGGASLRSAPGGERERSADEPLLSHPHLLPLCSGTGS